MNERRNDVFRNIRRRQSSVPIINAMTAAFIVLLAATCEILALAGGSRRSLTAPKLFNISAIPPSPTPPSASAAAPSAPRTKGACTYTVTRPDTTLHR